MEAFLRSLERISIVEENGWFDGSSAGGEEDGDSDYTFVKTSALHFCLIIDSKKATMLTSFKNERKGHKNMWKHVEHLKWEKSEGQHQKCKCDTYNYMEFSVA